MGDSVGRGETAIGQIMETLVLGSNIRSSNITLVAVRHITILMLSWVIKGVCPESVTSITLGFVVD